MKVKMFEVLLSYIAEYSGTMYEMCLRAAEITSQKMEDEGE